MGTNWSHGCHLSFIYIDTFTAVPAHTGAKALEIDFNFFQFFGLEWFYIIQEVRK